MRNREIINNMTTPIRLGSNLKLSPEIGIWIDHTEEKIILEKFIVSNKDRQMIIVDEVKKVWETFVELTEIKKDITFIEPWTWDKSNKISPTWNIVKLEINWIKYSHVIKPRFISKVTYFLPDCDCINNFKYTKEALDLGIIQNKDLEKQMRSRPCENWALDVINYGKF